MPLIHELISRAAEATPRRLAVVAPDGSAITFAEFDRQIRSLATWVAERTTPGDRVAVVADNSSAYAQLYYAVPRSGRVLTLINQRLSPAEIKSQLATTEPVILVGDSDYLAALNAADDVPSIQHVVPVESAQWRAAVAADPQVPDVAGLDEPAWLLYTSGSTGVPKQVIHTHRSVLAAVRGTVTGRSVQPHGVYLLPFPMCHIAGYNMLVHHSVGSTVVLAAQFRPAAFAKAVNDFRVTSCSMAPTMLHALLGYLEQTGTTLPSLRAIAYGSAAMPAGLIHRAIGLLDVDFHQGYGMTETGGNITFLGPDEHRTGDPSILASVGFPHSGVDVQVVDDDDVELGTGQVGEIVVRGDQVAGTNGWLRTGDAGRIDDDGRLWVVDRLKDVIVTGGENVASREVEDVLSEHPDVAAVAVVGVPDDYWGEAVCAVVAGKAGRHPSATDLVAYARSRIAPFKSPRHLLFVDELPLTTNGKVAKDVVRRYAAAHT